MLKLRPKTQNKTDSLHADVAADDIVLVALGIKERNPMPHVGTSPLYERRPRERAVAENRRRQDFARKLAANRFKAASQGRP
jgi:hypothetical protein